MKMDMPPPMAPDSMRQLHERMMADSVIRRRIMADTALRRMMNAMMPGSIDSAAVTKQTTSTKTKATSIKKPAAATKTQPVDHTKMKMAPPKKP